jgi:predicted Holliday junction resolvase-like endonuclease
MWVFLWGFIKPILWKLVLALAVIGTILAVMARLKNAGRLQEQVESKTRTIEAVKRKKELQRETRTDLRKSGRTSADELHDKWQRD